jgi:hypothetical protein
MRAENNLKLACYHPLHHKRMSRTTVAAQIITLDNVHGIHYLKLQQDSHENPVKTPSINKPIGQKLWKTFINCSWSF